MKKLLLLSLSVIVFSSAIPFRKLENKYGPWVTNVTENSFTVSWITEYEALAYIELAPEDGSAFEAVERPQYYQTLMGRRCTGKEHKVTVTGLEPGKSYRYRICVTEVLDDTDPYSTNYGHTKRQKPISSVTTLDNMQEQYHFAMFNDMHCKDEKYSNLAVGLDPKELDLILLNGDIASHMASADSLIKHVWKPISRLAARVPLVYAKGNHEGRGREFSKFLDFFPSPTGETYYSFRMGQVAFLILDGGEDKPDSSPEYSNTARYDEYRAQQLEWLKNEVKKSEIASAPIKIAVMHIPAVKFQDSWYSQVWLAENFNPVLSEAGVDLMLCGHHHKFIHVQPGLYDNSFPIFVNSHVERMDIFVDADKIKIQTVDEAGKVTRTYNL